MKEKSEIVVEKDYTDGELSEIVKGMEEATHAFQSSMEELSKSLGNLMTAFQYVWKDIDEIFYPRKKKWYVRLKEKFKRGDKNEKKSRTNS